MGTLEAALSLAKQGFHVFPVQADGKKPAIGDFVNAATRDPEKIRAWWIDPVMEIEQPYNIGISTTRFGDDEHLVAIDVDNKGEKHGDDEILRLELEGCEIPVTFEQITPTGGRHLIYRTPRLLKQGVDVLGKGLDVRAKGGYVLAAGSSIGGKLYAANGKKVAPAPEWLVQRLGEAKTTRNDSKTPPAEIDQAAARARAVHYLENEAPLAVEGQGGDATTFKVAAKVKDFGVNPETALELLIDHWNDNCAPPWDLGELAKKVERAYAYGTEQIGSAAPELQFDEVCDESVPLEAADESFLDEINHDFAIVYFPDGHSILYEATDSKGLKHHSFLPEATFKRMFSPFKAFVDGRQKGYAEIWLNWAGRREYKGVCFSPEREPKEGFYNLWKGFTCEPLAPELATPNQLKGLAMFLDHAFENVCHGDDELFAWLIGYFAHLVQKPYERPLTTLVFQGSKGTGKNALVDRVGNLLGDRQYLVAHDSRYLTSNFNSHLESCLLLVLDEAFWSGDKSAEGKLKGLTTQKTTLIERKGTEPYTVENLVRLVVIGNEDWLVPASADERRYAVFRMGEKRKQDTKFFEKMKNHLDHEGGNRVLLHYLKTFDLDQVDINIAPKTEALLDQKMNSISAFHQWWAECLHQAHIVFATGIEGWPDQVDKEIFRNAYKLYLKDRNIDSRWLFNEKSIGRKIKLCVPSIVSDQKRRNGTDLVNVYRLPPLDQARAEWEKFIGHKVNW